MKGFKCLFEEGKVYRDSSGVLYKLDNGVLWYKSHDTINAYWRESTYTNVINNEYEEVRQEVSWQEALEAWISGKKIMYKFDGITYDIGDGAVIDRELLEFAKWYIL